MYLMAGLPSQQSDVCGNGTDNQRVFSVVMSSLESAANGLPPTQATVQAHEEFELITDAFNEIRVHLQVVEIVAAHPGRLLYDTSLELLVQVLTVFGVIMNMRHEMYAGKAHTSLVTSCV